MSGSHNGQPPAPDARYNRDAMTAAARAFNRAAAAPPAEATQYDLTPPDALHPLTDIAAMRLEVARLADALNYANGRADALERRVKALEDAASAAHADLLQVYRLREGL